MTASSAAKQVPGWGPSVIGLAPVILWLGGIFPMDIARICGVVALGFAFRSSERPAPRLFERLSLLVVVLVPVATAVHLLIRLAAGQHGVDFAIFSQVVNSIATSGRPMTTLLFDQPVNFLSHHFAPILYVPGALAALGVSAPVALIVASCASLLAAMLAIRRFCISIGLEPSVGNAWALVAALSVSVRPEMLWGVHDEILAVGLLGWSMVWLHEGRLGRSLVLLLLCCTAKESFFVLPVFWLTLARLTRATSPWTRVERLAVILAVLWPLLGIAYVFLQPAISGREFDHLNKFDWAFMREHPLLADRGLFIVLPLLSLGFTPLVSWRAARWCVIALPFFILCVVSSDPEMFRPTGYHSVVPALLVAFAGAVGLKTIADRWARARVLVWVGVAAQLSFGASSLWLVARRLPEQSSWFPNDELVDLIGSARVAADPAAALALLPCERVSRLWSADPDAPPEFIVARPDGWEPIPEWAKGSYIETRVGPGWRVLRKK